MTLEDVLKIVHDWFEQHIFLRWVSANIAGWSLGLFLGGIAVSIIGRLVTNTASEIISLLLAGMITGAVVGLSQRWALTGIFDQQWGIENRWLQFSTIGGILGVVSLAVTWFTIVIGSAGFLVMGAVFGLIFSWVQTASLRRYFGKLAAGWVLANSVGGGFCALFTMTGMPFALPICCTFGPVTFGAITAIALKILIRDSQM